VARPKKATNAKGDTGWMRERVLEAAERLFARKGYGAATLREIGEQVGVSNATLLHHFGSKLELYRAVLDRLALALRRLADTSAADDGAEPLPALLRFFERFSAWTHDNPNYGQIAFRAFLEKTVRESHLDVRLEAEVLERLSELVLDGQRRGVFREDVDVEAFVVQLLTTVWIGEISSDTLAIISDREPEAYRSRFREQALRNLLRGLMVDEERTSLDRAIETERSAVFQ
jgi:TetR/AcrR family transcriptional regulator